MLEFFVSKQILCRLRDLALSIDQNIRRPPSPVQMNQPQPPMVSKDDFEVLKKSNQDQRQPLAMRGRSNTNPNMQRSRRSEPIMGQSQINSQQLQNMINPQILSQQLQQLQPVQSISLPLPHHQNQISQQRQLPLQVQQVPVQVQVHNCEQIANGHPQRQVYQQQQDLQMQQKQKQQLHQQQQQQLQLQQQHRRQHLQMSEQLQKQQRSPVKGQDHLAQRPGSSMKQHQVTINMSHRSGSRSHLNDDNMSVQSVPHTSSASHNSSMEESERPLSRSRAVSIEDLHRSPSRAKTLELVGRSIQEQSMIKFVSNSQSRRGAQADMAAASSGRSSTQTRRSRSREDLSKSPASPAMSVRPSSRTSMRIQEDPHQNGSPQPQGVNVPIQRTDVQSPKEDTRLQQANDVQINKENLQSNTDNFLLRIKQLEKEKKALQYHNKKINEVLVELDEKNQMFERMYKEERENNRGNSEVIIQERSKLMETNKILQNTVSKVQQKVDKLELENEELKVSFAVMKAEKHNSISALEAFKNKQQHVTDEIAHLYKLNSEQAVRITEFEKEKKLNTEEFAYLYKVKNEQASKINELEKDKKDFSQFHKTISDQAIKISELQSKNKEMENELIKAKEEVNVKTDQQKKETVANLADIGKLNETITLQLQRINNLEEEKKALNEKEVTKFAELESEVEQLRKTTSEQSIKIVELENIKNEKREILQANPRKDLLKDINKLKDHYIETINTWKGKYEETKMLLNLRDQELEIYKKRKGKDIGIGNANQENKAELDTSKDINGYDENEDI